VALALLLAACGDSDGSGSEQAAAENDICVGLDSGMFNIIFPADEATLDAFDGPAAEDAFRALIDDAPDEVRGDLELLESPVTDYYRALGAMESGQDLAAASDLSEYRSQIDLGAWNNAAAWLEDLCGFEVPAAPGPGSPTAAGPDDEADEADGEASEDETEEDAARSDDDQTGEDNGEVPEDESDEDRIVRQLEELCSADVDISEVLKLPHVQWGSGPPFDADLAVSQYRALSDCIPTEQLRADWELLVDGYYYWFHAAQAVQECDSEAAADFGEQAEQLFSTAGAQAAWDRLAAEYPNFFGDAGLGRP